MDNEIKTKSNHIYDSVIDTFPKPTASASRAPLAVCENQTPSKCKGNIREPIFAFSPKPKNLHRQKIFRCDKLGTCGCCCLFKIGSYLLLVIAGGSLRNFANIVYFTIVCSLIMTLEIFTLLTCTHFQEERSISAVFKDT